MLYTGMPCIAHRTLAVVRDYKLGDARMGKSWKSKGQKGAELRIAEEELKRRNGIIKIAGGIGAFIIVAIVHTWLIMNTDGAGDNVLIRGMVYMSAMVCAGFVGYGARDVYRANNAIRGIRYDLYKKSKKGKKN